MFGLFERLIDYFFPAHTIDPKNINPSLYARFNIGALISIIFLLVPLYLLNLLLLETKLERIMIAWILLGMSFASLVCYKYFGRKILKYVNTLTFVQALVATLCLSFVAISDGSFANPILFWFVVIIVVVSYYMHFVATWISIGVVFINITFLFFYLESEVMGEYLTFPNFHEIRFFLTDLVAILIYICFLVINYRNSKQHIDYLLKTQVEELKASRKLSEEDIKNKGLAKMAASMAHEINNPIFSIQGDVHMFRSMLIDGRVDKEKSLKIIDQIEQKLVRVSKIVRGVSSYARKKKDQDMEIVEFKSVLNDSLAFCSSRIRDEKIELITVLENDLHVRCYPIQLMQVSNNLLVNSLDSLISESQKKILIRARSIGKVLEVLFCDSGKGVEPELEFRIFEPFFSTKDPYMGTGLGLSISRSIAQEHGGSLFYDRREIDGEVYSCFVLILPLAEGKGD